jgi:REP element-mobilizing transposase RayT
MGRRTIRLRGFDYSQPGAYFVTICVQDRAGVFGEIVDGEWVPNEFGKIVEEEWERTGALRDYVTLDAFVVMPDHFYGILLLAGRGTARRAPTFPATIEKFGAPVGGSIPTIIRAFKSAVTRRVNEARSSPGADLWQRGYYEHVIRGEEGLLRLRRYIRSNLEARFGGRDCT